MTPYDRLIDKTLKLICELRSETNPTPGQMTTGVMRLRAVHAEWQSSGLPMPPEFTKTLTLMEAALLPEL